MFSKGDLVRFQAGFILRQFRTTTERYDVAIKVGRVMSEPDNLGACRVMWPDKTITLAYAGALEKVG